MDLNKLVATCFEHPIAMLAFSAGVYCVLELVIHAEDIYLWWYLGRKGK